MDIRLEDNVNLAPGEVVTSVPAKSPQSNTSVFWHLSVSGGPYLGQVSCSHRCSGIQPRQNSTPNSTIYIVIP